jgi:hypothetical protein
VYFPVRVRVREQHRAVLSLASALARGDRDEAAKWEDALDTASSAHEVLLDSSEPTVSPSLRARVLGSVLIDLARSGWRVTVEDGQVYLIAPDWSASAGGMSSEAVRAEKERARTAMAARVEEEIATENNRRFILKLESPRATSAGARSVLSLLADGPCVAAALRERGADAIQPVLCAADAEAGRDPETGLLYTDIFRYFRFFWSFPTTAPPGRSMSYLIRDAGQPGSPVCGLLCVASPVPRLSARDSALGWSAQWLECAVVALEFPVEAPREHLECVDALWRSKQSDRHAPSVVDDVGAMLGFPEAKGPAALAAALQRCTPLQRARRAEGVRARILSDLRSEVADAVRLICFDGFGFDHDFALERPSTARARLEKRRDGAVQRWLDSRRSAVADGVGDRGVREPDDDALKDASKDPLFLKKRVVQALRLLAAWEEIAPRDGERAGDRLREEVCGTSADTTHLSGGARVSRAARFALLQRQNRLVASQVLDVCVCGAIPPYGPVLGGKLAALAALSREVAVEYFTRYASRPSEITSQMAGQPVTRAADLLAMTTTSFFGVGSSQYERLSVRSRDGAHVRWRRVGHSRGNGTLHFSARTAALIDDLLTVETGRRLITSRFGEGPSERLRKIRDGLTRLGVDADELLRHGMPRVVYLAEVRAGAARPGARPAPGSWKREAPTFNDVSAAWRDRWLRSRLASTPAAIDEVAAFSRVNALLGQRLRARRDRR